MARPAGGVRAGRPAVSDATFDDYVRDRSVALQRFALLVTGNREDARDAVQDALVGLYPHWERVRAGGSVEAYVHRSIINAATSRWRRTRRTTPVDPILLNPAPSQDPTDAVADAQLAWSLCRELPVDQRAAVVLRFYQDRSYAEIARILDCPEATARSHVHRALARLRARLAGEDVR